MLLVIEHEIGGAIGADYLREHGDILDHGISERYDIIGDKGGAGYQQCHDARHHDDQNQFPFD
jgi:hypothetical protein